MLNGRAVCSWRAVICFIIYFVLGFFGAARWGRATDGNLLVNAWGPPAYQGVLNILLGTYLAVTNPPLVYPIAHVLRVRCPSLICLHANASVTTRFGLLSLLLLAPLQRVCLAVMNHHSGATHSHGACRAHKSTLVTV